MVYRLKTVLAGTIFFALLALKFICFFYPTARLWGINQLAYFSLPFTITYLCAILMVVFLVIYKEKLTFTNIFINKIKAFFKKLPQWLLIIAGIITVSGLFYLFRDKTNLLGDGMLRITELENFHYVPPTEPLDCLIHYLTFEYLLKPFGLSAHFCFQLLSYISGLLYIWAAWLLSKKLKKEGISQPLAFAYVAGWGGLMMFFGYVENYAFTSALVIFFFCLSLDYIHTSKRLIILVALFLLTFFMHNLAIYLLPSFLFLLCTKLKKNWYGAISGISVTILVILIWTVSTYSSKEGSAFLLPASSSDSGYLIWSASHLMDILNELFLISPAFLILIFLQHTKFNKRELQIRLFFWLAALSGLMLLLFLDPKLGMPRDWDLFAIPLLAFHIALLLGVDWKKAGKFITSAVAIISITFTALWVFLNSNEAQAIERYKNIVRLDKERSQFGYEQLALYFRKQQRWEETEQAYYESIKIKPHYRTCFNLGFIQYTFGKVAEAERNLKMALKLKPQFNRAKKYLGLLYLKTKHFEHARELINQYLKTPEGLNDTEAKEASQKLDHLLSVDENDSD